MFSTSPFIRTIFNLKRNETPVANELLLAPITYFSLDSCCFVVKETFKISMTFSRSSWISRYSNQITFNVQFSFSFRKCNTDGMLFYLKIKSYTNIRCLPVSKCSCFAGICSKIYFLTHFSYYICERKSTDIIIYYTVIYGVNGVFSTHVQRSEIVLTRRLCVMFFQISFWIIQIKNNQNL